ncbi:hypothetical protein BYT27DRAFT_7228940 [Phlegmacium glaucopus]|nr:hypothetical protein BYT27DRAFT_7228940 [Phlegmacium glaucopus]
MWSKITNALKNHGPNRDSEQSSSTVMSKVFEQHPNLSVFHSNESGVLDPQPSPPPSPSVHSKRNMFKRMSKPALKDDTDSQRAPSPAPYKLTSTIPRKVRNPLNSAAHPNGSQLSLNLSTTERPGPSQSTLGRSSFDALQHSQDLLYSSQGTTKSMMESRRRPSLDMLRQESSRPSPESLRIKTKNPVELDLIDANYNSVRSILRDPKTPGTGQNVRFFSREAFKIITPDQSMASDLDNKPQPAIPQEPTTFLDRLNQSDISSSPTPPSNKRSPPNSRPTVAEIFSPMNDDDKSGAIVDKFDASLSLSNPIIMAADRESSNLFDVSQQLDMSSFPPPGLEFDVNAPNFSLDSSANDHCQLLSHGGNDYQMTSTPYKPKDSKGKEKAIEEGGEPHEKPSIQIAVPNVVDETIFHAREKSPKFPPPLHERSQSFSFGQTMFYSMADSGTEADKSSTPPDNAAAMSSVEHKPAILDSSESQQASPALPSAKTRTRSMSDSVFQNLLRSSSSQPRQPEADINDDSTTNLVVYSGGTSEPDPFSAHANTYYTPQTMIPPTPPKGTPKHVRKASKEESLIISLQTQLALRTEMCGHYEADLKARDELVEILGKKLADMEKDDTKRKNALRSWKKKVQELERVCRQLEETVEDSKHESMERSIMDEASSEALRMLHRQIAGLEREKNEWSKREQGLREEIETLESLVKDRSNDIMNLKETLWTRDESERELQQGIRDAKEQMEMMGNVSVGIVDEEKIKKLMMERDQKNVVEQERHQAVELELRQEVEELQTKYESLQVQKVECEEQLEQVTQQLKSRDDEYTTLKAELEAQWDRTAKASEQTQALEKENADLCAERDALKADVEELEVRTSAMEVEWNESENKKNELETELQEVWNLKDSLEKERDEVKS